MFPRFAKYNRPYGLLGYIVFVCNNCLCIAIKIKVSYLPYLSFVEFCPMMLFSINSIVRCFAITTINTWNMCPSIATRYFINSAPIDGEFPFNFFTGVPLRKQLSDLYNLFVRQLGMGTSLATGICTMFTFIKMIIRRCIPPQIIKGAVVTNAIIVTGLHSRGALSHKGKQEEAVNVEGISPPSYAQRYSQITYSEFWLQYSLRFTVQNPIASLHARMVCAFSIRPNSPLVRNIIPGESRDRQPSLLNLIGDRGKVLVSHGVALLHRVVSRLEPLQGYSLVAA